MPTPHISAPAGAFADIVLMPGDPLRAQMIAETYLRNAHQVTAVRNMFGYTGDYQGRRISVMAHGMGLPSCSIYATELIKDYGVKTLIRVGSCGAVTEQLKLRDVIIAMGASTDSNVNRMRLLNHDFAALADYEVLRAAVDAAARLAKPVRVGNVFSTDLFYSVQPLLMERLAAMNVLAIEMELAGIYGIAAQYGARALGILTVSDIIPTGVGSSSQERQNSFGDMVEIALETAMSL
jgi:purine-nucleoside phosphorylase